MQRLTCMALILMALAAAWGAAPAPHGLVQGYLAKGGRPIFPIGIYEMPKTAAELDAMAKAGINLVRCQGQDDLDRAQSAGMMGWVPLPLDSPDQARLRQLVAAVKDHPAMAAWEGPDELVWGFTANSALYRGGIHKQPGEWWKQTPEAVAYADAQAAKVVPQVIANIGLLRSLDGGRHPLWMNEAAGSDLKFVREYVERVDITGCDTYPINEGKRHPSAAADYTDRFLSVGENRPVWMVLQGFAWADLHIPGSTEKAAYPSFPETRLMVYEALVHGARGILYWGTAYIPSAAGSAFRDSIYAMTRELAPLDPFLTAPEEKAVRVALTETTGRPEAGDRGVHWLARRAGLEWLIVLANEDDHPHMGVEVQGLEALNGRRLDLLYGTESATIRAGEFITRLMPQEVKVFSTSHKWESPAPAGRDFTDEESK